MDEIQAGLLRVCLKYIDAIIKEWEKCRKISGKIEEYEAGVTCNKERSDFCLASIYCKGESKRKIYALPCSKWDSNADSLLNIAASVKGVCILKYTKGMLSITEDYAQRTVSLPIYNGMYEEEIDYVIEKYWIMRRMFYEIFVLFL